MGFERRLDSVEQIKDFFDSIELSYYFDQNSDFVDLLKAKYRKSTKIELLTSLVNDIYLVHNTAENYAKNDTLTYSTNRDSKFHNDLDRLKLRSEIKKCCVSYRRNKNDDATSNALNRDGLGPTKGYLEFDNKAFLIIGGPACGKSTYANIIADYYGAYLLDSDLIKRKFPEFNTKGPASASLLHEESKKVYEDFLEDVVGSGVNIVTPIVGKRFDSLQESVDAFIDNDYKVYLILVHVNKAEATRRALKRYVKTERYVPLNYVIDICGNESVASFFRMACVYTKLSALDIDNTNKKGKILFERGAAEIVNLLKKKKVIV